jgi:AcrR family transcriptional regulator
MVMNRTRPREELRERIYEAAIAAFRERGYRHATVDEITGRAGVAKGTFFNFFPAKADALIAYYWRLDAEVAPWRKALDAADPLMSLARYARKVERLFLCEGSLVLDLINETVGSGSLRRTDEESGRSDAQDFAAFFTRCKAAKTMRRDLDAEGAASLLSDVWSGSIRLWLESDRKTSLAKIFQSRMEILFKGLGT